MSNLKIGIIGAGAAGLAAAWDFAHAGHQVTIFEAADRVGGLAAGFKDDNWDWTLEKFYHHWFANDHDILGLADEMGVRDKVIFPRPKTSYWVDGKPIRSEISPSAIFLPLSPDFDPCAWALLVWPSSWRPVGSLWSASPPISGCAAGWGAKPTRNFSSRC